MAKNQPYDGSYYVLLGGTNSETDSIEQSVIIPLGALSCDLTFALRIKATGNDVTPHDFLKVRLEGTDGDWHDLLQYSNADARDWTVTGPISLMDYVGQLVTLRFEATTDGTKPTKFSIDDVSLKYVPGSSVTPNLEFYSPTRGCLEPWPLDGLTVTGAAPLSLIASAPNGVQSVTAAIDDQQVASTTDTRLEIPINWSALTPGEHTLTGTITDSAGLIFRKQCTISSTNILQGADFELDDENICMWNQGSTGGAALIQDVGADTAYDGTGMAVLGGLSKSTDTLEQTIWLPDDTQDALTLSFFYETPAAVLSPNVTETLSIFFVDIDTNQQYPVATVSPTQAGWTLCRVPISLSALGLCAGQDYILEFQAAAPNSSSTIPFYLDDVALYVYSATLAAGALAPDDTTPDPDEGTFNSSGRDPHPLSTSLHYGTILGGDKLDIIGTGFDPASLQVGFRTIVNSTTSGSNWASATGCSESRCTGNSNNNTRGAISGVRSDGTVIHMGPVPTTCPTCGTPSSYGNVWRKARVWVKNDGNKHGLAFKDSNSNIVGFRYGYPPPTVTGISPLQGPVSGGTPITISGTNFVPGLYPTGTWATIGTVTAYQQSVNCPSGLCTMTAQTGTGGMWPARCPCTLGGTCPPPVTGSPVNVAVINPDGQIATLQNGGFTYTPVYPTVTSISPLRGSSNGQTSPPLTITGTNLGRVTAVYFGGLTGVLADCKTFPSTNSNTSISVAIPPGCGNQYIAVKNAETLSATSTGPNGTFTYVPTGPGIGSITSTTQTKWACVTSGKWNLGFQFQKGPSPCDDVTVSNITVTTIVGGSQSDITTTSSVVNGPSLATVTVVATTNKCPCNSTSTQANKYNIAVTVTSNGLISTCTHTLETDAPICSPGT